MIKKTAKIRTDLRWLLLAASALLVFGALLASPAARSQALDPVELEELVAPVALYPDDVLGVIFAASTFPLDIVQAARFLEDLEIDPSLQPDESWDESVVALLNYPEIIEMMNEDLDWTWALGQAVLTDETAVLAAAQDFRRQALAAGNLPSDDKQTVAETDGVITIEPTDPEVVYIPVYEPREVIVYHREPIYRYYPIGYPLYYYPYRTGYFADAFFWGVTSYFSIGWHTHHLHLYHYTHRSHPYYLSSYYLYTPYYYRDNIVVTVNVDNYRDVWRPRATRAGNRPRTVTTEGRTSIARTNTRTVTSETQPGVRTSATTVGRGSSPNNGATRTTRTTNANGSSRRQGAEIGGQLERSTTTTSRTATGSRSVASSASSNSQLRGVRQPTTSGSRASSPNTRSNVTTAPTGSSRTVTGSPSASTRTATPAPVTSSRSTATRSSGASGGGRVSAPRSAAPAPRSSAAPAPRMSSAAPRASTPAPSRSSSSGSFGGVRSSASTSNAARSAPSSTGRSSTGRSSASSTRSAAAGRGAR